MPVTFTGKYWHLLENTGKHWKIELTTLELKTNPTLNIYIWLISIIEARDTNNRDLYAS